MTTCNQKHAIPDFCSGHIHLCIVVATLILVAPDDSNPSLSQLIMRIYLVRMDYARRQRIHFVDETPKQETDAKSLALIKQGNTTVPIGFFAVFFVFLLRLLFFRHVALYTVQQEQKPATREQRQEPQPQDKKMAGGKVDVDLLSFSLSCSMRTPKELLLFTHGSMPPAGKATTVLYSRRGSSSSRPRWKTTVSTLKCRSLPASIRPHMH